MLLETLSVPLAKALVTNSTATTFASLDLIGAPPSGESVYPMGNGGMIAPNRLFLLPYCDGPAGSTFSMRVYGWRALTNPEASPVKGVSIPYLLAELLCVSCGRAAPSEGLSGQSPRFLQASERMCDTITLTQGATGPWYTEINSTGPGTDLIAFALVDVVGSRYIQFDFQQTDPVGMNCLWARC